jgi:hypothetical protein
VAAVVVSVVVVAAEASAAVHRADQTSHFNRNSNADGPGPSAFPFW